MTRNLGRLRVSYELLESLLRLPRGSIIDTLPKDLVYAWPAGVEFVVEHATLPAVPEGGRIPAIAALELVAFAAPPVEGVSILNESPQDPDGEWTEIDLFERHKTSHPPAPAEPERERDEAGE